MPHVRVRFDWPSDFHVRTLNRRRVTFSKQVAEDVSDAELAEIVAHYSHALEPVEEVKPGVWKRLKPDVLDLAADDESNEPPPARSRRRKAE